MRALQPGARLGRADTALMEVLEDRPGPVSRAHVHFASFRSCIPKLQGCCHRRRRPRRPNATRVHPAQMPCSGRDPQRRSCTGLAGGGAHNGILAVDPWFLTLLVLAIAVLAYIVARMASALQELAAAAEDLGDDLQRDPLPLRGPREVQRAAEAFNAMQHRLQRHLAERTQMLAAITRPADAADAAARCAWRMSRRGPA